MTLPVLLTSLAYDHWSAPAPATAAVFCPCSAGGQAGGLGLFGIDMPRIVITYPTFMENKAIGEVSVFSREVTPALDSQCKRGTITYVGHDCDQ